MRIDPVKVYRLRMKLESVGFTTDQVLALSNAAAIALVTNAALTGPQVRALESLIGDTVNPGDTIDANMFAIQRDRFASNNGDQS